MNAVQWVARTKELERKRFLRLRAKANEQDIKDGCCPKCLGQGEYAVEPPPDPCDVREDEWYVCDCPDGVELGAWLARQREDEP